MVGVFESMKRILLTGILLFSVVVPLRGQWSGGITLGVAVPFGGSGNAPELRSSFASGLRAIYALPATEGRWQLRLMVDGVRWMSESTPEAWGVPLDTGTYAKRYFFFPVTAGVGYSVTLGSRCYLDAYATVGGYYRLLNCQRMRSVGVVYDMEEHGLGFALKVGGEVRYANVSLGVSLLALGNPFEKEEPLQPQSKAVTHEFSQPTMKGYGQSFVTFEIGYWLRWK